MVRTAIGKRHKVTKVQVLSQDFADSRFTGNGWIHRT